MTIKAEAAPTPPPSQPASSGTGTIA
jgi:hypothetical protein